MNGEEDLDEIEETYKSFSYPQQSSAARFVSLQVPDVIIKSKDSYKKQSYCTVCSKAFSTTYRQHHCRICANAVCATCSKSLVNREKACDLCVYRFSNPAEEKKKKDILETLETFCAFLVYRRDSMKGQIEQIQSGNAAADSEQKLREQREEADQIKHANMLLKEEKKFLEQKLDQFRAANFALNQDLDRIDRDSDIL